MGTQSLHGLSGNPPRHDIPQPEGAAIVFNAEYLVANAGKFFTFTHRGCCYRVSVARVAGESASDAHKFARVIGDAAQGD